MFRKSRNLPSRNKVAREFQLLETRLPLAVVTADTRQTHQMADEGYLKFADHGHERSGVISTVHPSTIGAKDSTLGYDLGDLSLRLHTTKLDNSTTNWTLLDIVPRRDFDYANQIFSQIGISITSTGWNDVSDDDIVFPVDNTSRLTQASEILQALTAGADWDFRNNVEVVYLPDGVRNTDGTIAHGQTHVPPDIEQTLPGGGIFGGILIAEGTESDALAHEVGHWLLLADGSNYVFNHPGDYFHATLAKQLMSAGLSGNHPNSITPPTKDGSSNLDISAPSESGRVNGKLGGKDLLSESVYLPQNVVAGFLPQSQGYVMRGAKSLQSEKHVTYGDRADFTWVEDNRSIEDLELLPSFVVRDELVWTIPTAPLKSPSFGGANADLLGKTESLDLGRFQQETFNYVDVVSLVARYADNDVGPLTQQWTKKAAALDYTLEFCENPTGTTCSSGWEPGTIETIFEPGWSANTEADDFLARWKAPEVRNEYGVLVPKEVKSVRIKAATRNGADGNTQIDAIIAGKVVENISARSFEYHTEIVGSEPTGVYAVGYEVDDSETLTKDFTIAIYGSTDGVSPGVLLDSRTVNWDVANCAIGTADHCVGSEEFDFDLGELASYTSIIAVVDSDSDITESIEGDNTLQTNVASLSPAYDSGGVTDDANLNSPLGIGASVDGTTTYLWTISNTGKLVRTTTSGGSPAYFPLVDDAVASTDYRDIAVAPDGSDEVIYISAMYTETLTRKLRIIRVVDPSGCSSNIDEGTDPCQYEEMKFTFPANIDLGGTTPLVNAAIEASTLIVDPYNQTIYVITESGPSQKSLLFKTEQTTTPSELEFVGELAIHGVIGGDVLRFENDSSEAPYVILQTKTDQDLGTTAAQYLYSFGDSSNVSNILDSLLQRTNPILLPFDSSRAGTDVAIDPRGNGVYRIGSSSVGVSPAIFPIWHSEPAPPLEDVQFAADGNDFTFTYTLPDDYPYA